MIQFGWQPDGSCMLTHEQSILLSMQVFEAGMGFPQDFRRVNHLELVTLLPDSPVRWVPQHEGAALWLQMNSPY